MEGFVPRPDGQGFERRDKTFRIINQRALDDRSRPYVLLIEEFTRANVHSVLGELLTFVEHRGRKFTLSLSQEEMAIAPNLVIIATMNPRDRSALTLDDAIVRRMYRIPLSPSSQSLRHMLEGKLGASDLDALVQWFDQHTAILPFGHGVFAEADSASRLLSIWEGTIVPLIADPLGQIPEAYQDAHRTFPFRGAPSPPDVTPTTG
jgi:5-methylcytosine-specific restriction protein B